MPGSLDSLGLCARWLVGSVLSVPFRRFLARGRCKNCHCENKDVVKRMNQNKLFSRRRRRASCPCLLLRPYPSFSMASVYVAQTATFRGRGLFTTSAIGAGTTLSLDATHAAVLSPGCQAQCCRRGQLDELVVLARATSTTRLWAPRAAADLYA